MSVNETYAAFQFIYSTLSADSTLTSLLVGGIWRGVAPERTATPFAVMEYQAGTDTITMNANRILTLPLLQVKVTGPASISDTIAQADGRVDDLLKHASGTVTGGYIAACYRENPFWLDELVNGELWTNIGGLYRMNIQQTS